MILNACFCSVLWIMGNQSEIFTILFIVFMSLCIAPADHQEAPAVLTSAGSDVAQSVCYRDSSWLISHVMEYLRDTRLIYVQISRNGPTIIRSKQNEDDENLSMDPFHLHLLQKVFFNWTPGDDGPVQPGRSAELSGEKSWERWRWGWRRLDRAVCSLMFLTKRRECGWIHGCASVSGGFVFYMIVSCCCIVLLTLTSYSVYICLNVFISVWGEKHPKDAVMN